MTRLLIILLISLALVAVVVLLFKDKKSFATITINDTTIKAELADTAAKRTKGLMFRKNLPQNTGMLFVFNNEAKHTFWMANTFIPLDIIWINSQKEVVHIEKSVPPCTESVKSMCTIYKPDEKAKYVLELNAGKSEKLNLQVEDTVNFNL